MFANALAASIAVGDAYGGAGVYANALAAGLTLGDAYESVGTFGNLLLEPLVVSYSVEGVVGNVVVNVPGAQVARPAFESSRPVQAVTYRLDAIGGSRPESTGGTRSANTSKAKR